MVITKTNKLAEGVYEVTSLPCPKCGDTLTTEITGEQLFLYNQNGSIQTVLPNLRGADRERFISGYCQDHWLF